MKIFVIPIVFFSMSAWSQGNTYIDAVLPGRVPKVFARGVVSMIGTREGVAMFSPDGREFYFTKVDSNKVTQIMEMKRTDSGWSKAARWVHSSQKNNWELFITPNNEECYFVSTREQPETEQGGKLWHTARKKNGWSQPKQLSMPVSSPFGFWFPTLSRNKHLYFGAYIAAAGHFGKSDIYVYSLKADHEVYNLGPVINTPHEEWDPWIAPDESYLIFASDRPGGFGKVDLYVTFRKEDGWGPPVNLGGEINSTEDEVAPRVSHDGKYMFFDRPQKTEQDIYWVSADIISELKNISVKP